jgi:periplasmic protein CpxP/Spy
MMQSPSRKPRLLAAVLILSAVALGAIGGIAFDRLVLLPRSGYAGEVATPADTARPGPTGARQGIGPHGRMPGDRYLRHLAEELELTEEQRTRLEVILRDQQDRVLEITRDSRPRIREVANQTREAMREVLTPEQWERFQEMRARRDRRDWPGGERMRDSSHGVAPAPGGS